MIQQVEFKLQARSRGYHIVTSEIMEYLPDLPQTGLVNLYIKHTSAALAINENADPDVLTDFESIMNMVVPENLPFLTHTVEGPDDMPAHIKAAMMGSSITVPVTKGRFNFGTWQGIYLCEFRNRASRRSIVATIYS